MTSSRNILAPRLQWSADEIAMLRALYACTSTPKLAKILGRPERAVYQKAYDLGLMKSAEYLASPEAGRLQAGDTRGGPTRFRKGHAPANKGITHRPGWAPGRMAEGQFKKGRAPAEARNYRPIGTMRVNKDGYLERKVSDDRSIVPARRWVGVHRLAWIEAHGPIPADRIVVFKRGRFTTDEKLITADALEMITRVELMARNSYHQYPHPIPQLIQLRGAVQRQINKRTKCENEDHRPA